MSTIADIIKKSRIFVQNHVRGTVVGDAVVSFYKTLGVNDLLTRILYSQERKSPTKGMQNTEKFLSERQKELTETANLFADDLSKEIYFSVMKYRATHNPKDAPKYSKHDQYFVKSIVSLSDNEVFVDCGAYDGDTMKEFMKASHGKYQQIICFEPMKEYHKKIEKHGKGKNVTAICAGVYKETSTLHFTAEGKGSAITKNEDASTITVPVRAIDDTPECRDATFIKMDIEGSEKEALAGAKETILRNKPKLAICL